ncbi:MAG: hypothetical protein AAGD13_20810 [Pseudomonadota bacterium]
MRFLLISRDELVETNEAFREACAARRIALTILEAGSAGTSDLGVPGERAIYTAAADRASGLLETLIARPGDALLHDPDFVYQHQPIVLRKNGVPMARAVYIPDPDLLASQADWLGGYPVVVKRPGTEGGAGVSLAHELPELQTALEDCPGAMLEEFTPHVRGWRATVLGDEALAMTATRPAEGDFRTNAPGHSADPDATVPDGLADLAIRAVTALRLRFGGVDILEGADGALTLTEVNFPCFFADQQTQTGVDIAGSIVDYLAARVGLTA